MARDWDTSCMGICVGEWVGRNQAWIPTLGLVQVVEREA